MKAVFGIFVAGTLLLTTGCTELKEIAEEYKAEQAAAEAEQNRIRTLDLDQPIAKLSVEAISEEFESNSVMAEDKYMNQPVELTGYIGSIDDSLFDEKNVSITVTGGQYSFSSVSCTKPRSAPEVRELRKGMRVAVRGVVTSEEMGVELSRCKFWLFSEDRWIGANQRTTEERRQTQQASNFESQQTFLNNRQDESTDRSDNNEIEQGKARFYSSTSNETKDIGVELSYRTNQNKHTILDAEWEDGFKSSYVFWNSGIVEILSKDGEGKLDNTPGTWTQIDGNTVITSKTGSITIFPGLEPTAH